MTTENKRNFLINLSFAAVIAIGAYFLLRFAASYLFPFLIGVVFAALVQKPALILSKRLGVKNGIVAAVMVLLVFVLSIAVIFLILSEIYSFFVSSLASLKDFLPRLNSSFSDFFLGVENFFRGLQIGIFSSDGGASLINSFFQSVTEKLTESLSNLAAKTVSALPSLIFSLSVTVLASCYIAKDYENIRNYLRDILPENFVKRCAEIGKAASCGVLKMVKGYFFMFMLTFFLLAVGFFALGRKNFIMLALLVSVVDVLPVLGTGTVLLPWAAVEQLFGETTSAVGLLLLYLTVMIVRHIAEPKIIGVQTGLHPLICLGAMFVGFKSAGFWGLLIFPLALTVVLQLIKSGKIKI